MNIYRIGGPTHTQWLKDLDGFNKVIAELGALVTDPEDGWIGVDPTKLPEEMAGHYSRHIQLGAWHGWLAA